MRFFSGRCFIGWAGVLQVAAAAPDCQQDEHKADDPSRWLAEADSAVTPDRHQPDCKDHLADQLQRAGQQRLDRVADALQHIAQDHQYGHRRDDRYADLEIQHRIGDDARITAAGDKAQHRLAQQEGKRQNKKPPDKIDLQRCADALTNAAAAACAVYFPLTFLT